VIGLLSATEVYVAQLIWPASEAFPNVDTAYVHVQGALGPLFAVVDLHCCWRILGRHGCATGRGAATLWHGRSNALPKSFFGAVDEKITFRAIMFFVGESY